MMNSPSPRYGAISTCLAFVAVLTIAAPAEAQPTFSKAFNPATIGPGSIAALQFTIDNTASGSPVTDLAFTDSLPAGVVVAGVPNALNFCGGTFTASAGGSTITLSGGLLGATATCTIVVDVTSSTPGTHTNTSGDLTSSAGNSGTASADLTVATDRPGFSKSFAPSSVALGGRSTLTLTVDNSSNAAGMGYLQFSDALPVGMVIADPANASTDCESTIFPPVLTAIPGSSLISLSSQGSIPSFPVVGAESTCTVAVDVVGGGAGFLGNTTGELMAGTIFDPISCGKAAAVLEVIVDPISLKKSFIDDPVPGGGTVTLEFTITNFDRNNPATNVTFTDNLETTLAGLSAIGLPAADVCGAGSSLSETSVLTLTGGNLPPGGSCTFSATLRVPAGAATGAYPNTTSTITADIGGSPVVGSPAAEILFVSPAPVLTKSFTDDPVGGGDSVTLEFTITNTSSTDAATGIGFEDIFDVILRTASATPAPGFCGPGSTATFTPLVDPPAPSNSTPARITVTGASLAPGASCTFSITLDVTVGAPSGIYPNVTTPITATVGDEPTIGSPAADDLVVAGGPGLLKEFTDDPVQPGGTVTLEFTLTHDEFAPADATDIAFTDNLDAALTGLAATGLPISDVCGTGSQITGTTALGFSGGALAPGESCSFSVTLQVPMTAPAGPHTNTTSNVSATVSGVPVTQNTATDNLMIAGLVLTKSFIDDPAFPGGPVTLQFTIENISPVSTATSIFFADNLASVISGLSASGLPLLDPCGTGSSLSGSAGNTLLSFVGGTLAPGASCSFGVTLQVPPSAANDTYINSTDLFTATIDGSQVSFPNASAPLVVSDDRLLITKTFTDDPVQPGDTATLEFTLTNIDVALDATTITFTDDLDSALTGLAAVGLPTSDVCGAGSQISGAGILTLNGGSLAPGGSCTFSLPVQVPVATAAGSYTNVTSQIAGQMGGFTVTGDPAADDLLVELFTFSKAFGGPAPAGDTTTLTFTIENLDSSAGAFDISFADDLEAVVPGMTAIGLPAADVCGSGSLLSGTSVLTLTGGNLGPGGACSFSVDVHIPSDAPVGTYVNTTSALSEGGIPAAEPATATIDVEAAAAGAAIPATTPLGALVLIALLAAAAVWRLNWRV